MLRLQMQNQMDLKTLFPREMNWEWIWHIGMQRRDLFGTIAKPKCRNKESFNFRLNFYDQ